MNTYHYYKVDPQRLCYDVSSRSRRARPCHGSRVTGQLQLRVEVGGLEDWTSTWS